MKQLMLNSWLALILLLSTTALFADDAAPLAGKWSVRKTNERGEKYTQTIEIKNDKFIFEILDTDNHVVLHAQGDLKLEKVGPFNAARFLHIRGGRSASEMDDVDDEYLSIYTLEDNTWTLASNFDKQRQGQKPSADLYQRVSQPASAPAKSK
jgi:hypothetical protein